VITGIEERGRRAAAQLRKLPGVREVRQRGYYFAIDMESAEQVQQMVEHCMQQGIITFWFLSCPWSFRIAPPLTLSDEEWEWAMKRLQAFVPFPG